MASPIEVTVAAVAQQQNKFLVIEEQSSGKLVLNQPAGHLEPGETLLEAVARETLEEAGREFEPSALLGIYLWRNPINAVTLMRFAFLGTVGPRLVGRPLDDGIVDTHWLTPQALRQQESRLRSPVVMQCVDECLAGVRYPLAALTHWDFDALEERIALP